MPFGKGLHHARRVLVQRVDDLRRGIERTVGRAHRLVEVALALGRRGHRVIARILRHRARQELLREEEEEFVPVPVEVIRNVDRPADIAAHRLVTIRSARRACGVVEKVVGVERFIAHVVVAQAVEILGPALGDHVDHAGRALAVLRLVVVEQDLHFGDGIHVDRRIQARAAARVARNAVDVGDAVHAARAGEGRRRILHAQAIGAAAVIDHAGKRGQQAEYVAPAGGQLADLVGVDQRAAFRTRRLHRSRLRPSR